MSGTDTQKRKAPVLSVAQASAVVAAMAHLNNVGARVRVMFNDDLRVVEESSGVVRILRIRGDDEYAQVEYHSSQGAFAAAYGV